MVDTATRRDILELVARGELSPQDAAALLSRLESPEQPPLPDDPAGAAQAPAAPSTPLHREHAPTAGTGDDPASVDPAGTDPGAIHHVHVRSALRSVTVIGDDDVQGAVADGDHTARIDGDTMTIEAVLERPHGFSFVRTGPMFRSRARGVGERANALVVRMNPHLAMTATVEAGSMNVHGVHGPIDARVQAGALVVEDVQSPFDVKVAAGQATLSGRMSSGTSHIECDAGQVAVLLTPDSSVRIHATVNLGQLRSPEVVGAGDATLNIVANLGAVDISVQEDE